MWRSYLILCWQERPLSFQCAERLLVIYPVQLGKLLPAEIVPVVSRVLLCAHKKEQMMVSQTFHIFIQRGWA